MHLADITSIRGRHDEAAEICNRGLELDPISRVFRSFYGLLLYRARRFDESIAQCRRALEIDPKYVNARWFMSWSLEQKGSLAEAIAALEEAVGISRAPHLQALLGRAYGLAGERTRALAILDELMMSSRHQFVSPFDLAMIPAGLGDADCVFHWLEQAYEQRVWRIIELTLPIFDPLHADPRWQDLVQRIGLPH